MRKTLLFFALTSVFALTAGATFAQNSNNCNACRDVLALGQRVIKISSAGTRNEDTKSWFCSSEFESYMRSSNFKGGITVPIEGVPVTFSANSDNREAHQRRAQFCSSDTRQFNQSDTFNIFEQLADANVVKEWGKCIERVCSTRTLSSLAVEMERSGEGRVNISLKWSPRYTGEQPPTITSVRYGNLTCPGDLVAKDTVVHMEGLAETCTSDRRQESTLIVNTTGGSVSKTLPRNLDGMSAGSAFASGSVSTSEWRRAGKYFRDKTTGDNHCGGGMFGCSGEDRRTRYTLDITVGTTDRLTNPRLNCLSGPCGGWFHIWHVIITNDGHRAEAAFDTWSRPTTWRLTCDWEKLQRVSRSFSSNYNLTYGRQVTISMPRNRVAGQIRVVLVDGNQFTITPGESRTGLFELANRIPSGGNELFTYRVVPPVE